LLRQEVIADESLRLSQHRNGTPSNRPFNLQRGDWRVRWRSDFPPPLRRWLKR